MFLTFCIKRVAIYEIDEIFVTGTMIIEISQLKASLVKSIRPSSTNDVDITRFEHLHPDLNQKLKVMCDFMEAKN